MKILMCFGTRPEAIKMAPVYFALKKAKMRVVVCVTSQHQEMLHQVLDFFEIKPEYNLNVMKPNQGLNQLSISILDGLNKVLLIEKPNLLLVHGDTTTSMIAALTAFNLNIKVGHVEAGLRTYNKRAPYPEELNRQITGRISDYHFAPTSNAKQNLLNEFVDENDIVVTGNTVVDSLNYVLDKIKNGYTTLTVDKLKNELDFERKLVLVTGHRRESFGQGFENLCDALLQLSQNKSIEIVYPVHLNPNVKDVVFDRLCGAQNIKLIEPLDYPSMIWLMSKAKVIISDSGGIQEEAPSLGVPVVITREITERNEGIASGYSFITGTNPQEIIKKTLELLSVDCPLKSIKNPYGDGDAANLIVRFLKNQNYNVA
jgi:UDP-N-acetylglucosamine 2-epimerase (non-hydrolysing)